MKKTYIIPMVETAGYESERLLDVSGVYSEQGIGYGGVDEEGQVAAETRRRFSAFDEEE
jgi:hypothetical protein